MNESSQSDAPFDQRAFEEWARFIDANVHVLSRYPELLFQQAANDTSDADPARAASSRWEHAQERRPWIRLRGSSTRRTGSIATLTGLRTPATKCCLSPTGELAAAGAMDGTVSVWNVRTGLHVAECSGHETAITACFFSTDGRRLYSCGGSSLICWNARTGMRLGKCKLGGPVRAAATLPRRDDAVIAVGRRLEIWSLATLTRERELGAHPGAVDDCCVSTDGQLIASCCDDGIVRVWTCESGELYRTLAGHTTIVRACHFGPGDILATGDWDGTIFLWAPRSSANSTTRLTIPSRVDSLALVDDGRRVLVSQGAALVMIRMDTDERVTLGWHAARIRAISTRHDSVMTASDDMDAKLWSWTAPHPEHTPRHEDRITAACFSPAGDRIATGGGDGTLLIRNAEEGRSMRAVRFDKPVQDCRFSPDGRFLACTTGLHPKRASRITVLYDRADEPFATLDTADWSGGGLVRSVRFSPDGRLLLFGTFRGTLVGYDVLTEAVRWQHVLFDSADIGDIGPEWAVFLRSRYENTGDFTDMNDGGLLVLLRWADGSKMRRREYPRTSLVFAKLVHESRQVLVGTADGHIIVLDYKLKERESVKAHPDALLDACLTRDGRRLASCGRRDPTVQLFSLAPIKRLASFEPSSRAIALAFIANDELLATLTLGGMVEIWDVRHQRLVSRYPTRGVHTIMRAVSAGEVIAIGDSAGTVELLEAAWLRP